MATDLRTCRTCRKFFNYLTGPMLCPACREALEEKFQEVKAYIKEHKGVNIQNVSDACDVEPAQIKQWLREDRLELTEDSVMALSCENCGAHIRSGRFCEKCKASMASNLRSVLPNSQPVEPTIKKKDTAAKMRYLQ